MWAFADVIPRDRAFLFENHSLRQSVFPERPESRGLSSAKPLGWPRRSPRTVQSFEPNSLEFHCGAAGGAACRKPAVNRLPEALSPLAFAPLITYHILTRSASRVTGVRGGYLNPTHRRTEKEHGMSTTQKVAVLVGSIRKDSLNRKAALALAALAPAGMELQIVEINELGLYNQDLDQSPPPAWAAFRAQVKAADAVLFVTPEYNRSVPGVLKNAIDVGSRPYGQSVWSGKPGAVMSVAPGALGGFGANHHLRQSMVFLNVPMMQQPEAYVGGAANLFDETGAITNDGTKKFFENFINAFSAWIKVHTAG